MTDWPHFTVTTMDNDATVDVTDSGPSLTPAGYEVVGIDFSWAEWDVLVARVAEARLIAEALANEGEN